MTALEVAANAVTAVAIVLAGRNSVHNWSTGIVGAALFGALFWQAKLYADAALQIFFILTSIWGWRHWLRGERGRPVAVTRAPPALLAGALGAAVAVTAGYGAMLHKFTDAVAPFTDSAVLALSVVAQLLLMQRKLETWWFWLAVNTVAVPLFASRGLYLTAALYAGYWVNAIYASYRWRRLVG